MTKDNNSIDNENIEHNEHEATPRDVRGERECSGIMPRINAVPWHLNSSPFKISRESQN